MTKRASADLDIITKGIAWRKLYLSRNPIQSIATKSKLDAQLISRAIWLAKMPKDIKETIQANPEIFTRTVLISGFASKRKRCEQDDFKLLRHEVERMIKVGIGSAPHFPKKINKVIKKLVSVIETNKKRKEVPLHPMTSPIINLSESFAAESRMKEMLGFGCRVAFNKSGASEVTFFLEKKKDLEVFIEMIEPKSGLF